VGYPCTICGKVPRYGKTTFCETCLRRYEREVDERQRRTKPMYNSWDGMKDRCYNRKCDDYPNYGARGIQVCEEWRTDYFAFQEWSLKNGWAKGLTLDRIDNDKNYEPGNCRWTTRKVQNQNKRR